MLDELWAEASDTEYCTTTERFSYYRCPDCDCLAIHPLPEGRLNEIYPPNYYSFASGVDKRGPISRLKAALDARAYRQTLELLGEPSPRILDVGGGTGEILERFVRESGGRASGTVIDIDPRSIEVARERGLSGFVGRFEDFEAEESADLVLMLNLIEHVADPIAILRKARRLLAPGGIVWLQTPNFRALDARLFRNLNWGGYHCPRHWVIFSEEGVRRALATVDLEPATFQRTQGGSFWAASLLGLRRARRIRRSWDQGTSDDRAEDDPGHDAPRALTESRAYLPLAAVGAAFDLGTRRVRQVSQVVVRARGR